MERNIKKNLAACPICGGHAHVMGLHKPVKPWVVDCFCGHRTEGYATDKEAIEAWNRAAKIAKVA